MVHKRKIMISPDVFFIVSKFCFSGSCVKGQKKFKNDKELCVSFLFHYFRVFIFWVFKVVKGYQLHSVTLYISGTVDLIIEAFGTQV